MIFRRRRSPAASRVPLNRNTAHAALRTASNGDARERKVRALRTAQHVHFLRLTRNAACHVAHIDAINDDPIRRGTGRTAVLIVLLDDDAVVRDAVHRHVRPRHVPDAAGRARDGLDAQPVLRGRHRRVPDGHVADVVVRAPADAADRDPVRPVAGQSRDVDIRAGVDRHAVVLVVDRAVRDRDAVRAANIHGVGVVRHAVGTGGAAVVESDARDGKTVGLDGHELDGGVLEGDAADGGLVEGVGGEDLGFVTPPLLPSLSQYCGPFPSRVPVPVTVTPVPERETRGPSCSLLTMQ